MLPAGGRDAAVRRLHPLLRHRGHRRLQHAGISAWAPTNNPYFEIVIGSFHAALRRQLQSVLLPADAPVPGRVPVRGAARPISSSWRRQRLPSPWTSCTCTQSVWAPACATPFFQVSSIITTTGYATADFNTWPTFSKAILVVLMFIGACAGSTAGGIKVARVVILQQGVCQRDAADAPPQCGARHPVRGQAPERAEHPGRPSVSGACT